MSKKSKYAIAQQNFSVTYVYGTFSHLKLNQFALNTISLQNDSLIICYIPPR